MFVDAFRHLKDNTHSYNSGIISEKSNDIIFIQRYTFDNCKINRNERNEGRRTTPALNSAIFSYEK